MHPTVPAVTVAQALEIKRTCIVIPARMASRRFPNKPLALVEGEPLIRHAVHQAHATGLPVYVATPDSEIVRCVGDMLAKGWCDVVKTRPEIPTGSDRCAAAVAIVDPAGAMYDTVINFQGDMLELAPGDLCAALKPLQHGSAMGTLIAPMQPGDLENGNVVKCLTGIDGPPYAPHDFCRQVDLDHGAVLWHHVGVYAFTRQALVFFARLPPAPKEIIRSLEQMRAMAHAIPIGVERIAVAPKSVNIIEDLYGVGGKPVSFWPNPQA